MTTPASIIASCAGNPSAAGMTPRATFVDVPISAMLRTVPMPGRSPSGHHGREDRDADEDAHGAQLEAGQARDALVEHLPGPEARGPPGPWRRCRRRTATSPDEQAGQAGQDGAGGPAGRGVGHPANGTGAGAGPRSRRLSPRQAGRRRAISASRASAVGARPRTRPRTSPGRALPPEAVDPVADPRVPARVAVDPVAARRRGSRPGARPPGRRRRSSSAM